MNPAPYSAADLSVIIPTLGRDLHLLEEILGRLRAQTLASPVSLVWDADQPPPAVWAARCAERFGCCLLRHPHNLGLAAARNTGVRHLTTRLGLFLDDDILPEPGTVAGILAFHERFPATAAMQAGKVTWQGGACQSPLTDWFESRGNWQLLSASPDLAPLSSFAGGFTSFKAEAFAGLAFDESFRRYGCEDVEFGHRFFAAGGSLRFTAGVVGIHHKPLSLGAYVRDHVAAGYSKGVMAELHPDLCFRAEELLNAWRRRYPNERLEELLALTAFTLEDESRSAERDFCLGLVTEQALQRGFLDYFAEKYPDFGAALPEGDRPLAAPPDLDGLCRLLPEFAPLLVEQARACADPAGKTALLHRAAELAPGYALPRLELARLHPETELATLRRFFTDQVGRLDGRTANAVRRALGETLPLVSGERSPRDLYLELAEHCGDWPQQKIAGRCLEILAAEPGFVSAYLPLIEQTVGNDPAHARVWLSQARHFLQFRPLAEREARRRQLDSLAQQLKETLP